MPSQPIELAKSVLEIEAQAILAMTQRIGESFMRAVDHILKCKGKVVVTGIGKSGHIGRKMASTFSSTGTPSVYMHPAESGHGDLGLIMKDDIVIAISYGGETSELTPVINHCARKNIPLIAMTGKSGSSLASAAAVVLDVSVHREACPLGLAPTASSTATLALGDALAMTVLDQKGFSSEDFAENHPGGGLGFKLARVKDLMHSGQELPLVPLDATFRQILSVMTHKDVRGAAGVVDAEGGLVGIITDGLIRKRLEGDQEVMMGTAKDLMTKNPKTIDLNELVEKSLFLMEQFQINQLFVIDGKSATPMKPIGLIHVQDLIRAKVR